MAISMRFVKIKLKITQSCLTSLLEFENMSMDYESKVLEI